MTAAVPSPYKYPVTTTYKPDTIRATSQPAPQPQALGPVKPAAVPAPTPPAPSAAQKSAQDWINNPSSGQGGLDAYTASQNQRWQQANSSGDADLMARLQADSQRVGYALDSYKPNTAAPTTFGDWNAKQNELMSKYNQLAEGSFSYDPNTDPRYQAYRDLAKSRAADASQSALETMNDRGILNSSVTASQLGQIQQRAEQEAQAAIPQFYDTARQDYQDKLRNAAEALSFATGRADAARGQQNTDRAYNYQTGRDAVTDSQWQQGMDYQKQSDAAKMEYQQARDAIADDRYKQQFDEDARRWGLEYATNKAIQEGQLQVSRQNAATSAANAANDNARQWAQLDWQMTQAQKDNYQGLTANQVLSNMQQLYSEPTYGPPNALGARDKVGTGITKDPAKREQMFLSVIDSNLPDDNQTMQVLTNLGFTKDEINNYMKKYGG